MDLARGGCDEDSVPEKPEVPATTGGGDNRGIVAKAMTKTKNEKSEKVWIAHRGIFFFFIRLPPCLKS